MTNKRKELKNLLKSGGVLTNVNGGSVTGLASTDMINTAAVVATATRAAKPATNTSLATVILGANSGSAALGRVAKTEIALGNNDTSFKDSEGYPTDTISYLTTYTKQPNTVIYTPPLDNTGNPIKAGILAWIADQIKASTAPILTALGGNETQFVDDAGQTLDIITYLTNYTTPDPNVPYTPTSGINAGILAWIADQISASAAASAAAASGDSIAPILTALGGNETQFKDNTDATIDIITYLNNYTTPDINLPYTPSKDSSDVPIKAGILAWIADQITASSINSGSAFMNMINANYLSAGGPALNNVSITALDANILNNPNDTSTTIRNAAGIPFVNRLLTLEDLMGVVDPYTGVLTFKPDVQAMIDLSPLAQFKHLPSINSLKAIGS